VADLTIEDHLQAARDAIAAEDDELDEARRRRRQAEDALRAEFPGCRIVPNGSLAHGDANTPLTDWDLVVVISDPDDEYGPGKKSSLDLKERAKEHLRAALSVEYPKLTVIIKGQKRAVLLRYSEPVTPGTTDFTGDAICAIDHPARGLYIPRHNTWDRSHPEEHNSIVRKANERTSTAFSRAVRLLKHWNMSHGSPMCSWHIKVLANEAITTRLAMQDALLAFFDHAAATLETGDTPDPAGVGPDIKTLMSPTDTVQRLTTAATNLRDAIQAEADGRPIRAQHHLAFVLPDIVPKPDPSALDDEDFHYQARRLGRGSSVGVGPASTLTLPRNRSWRHD
jgi:predicted nucleotidyltransferase